MAECTEVSTVETVRVAGEHEDLAAGKPVATMPNGQGPMLLVAGKGSRADDPVHQDAVTGAAHAIAGDPSDELHQIRRLGQVSAPIGQIANARW